MKELDMSFNLSAKLTEPSDQISQTMELIQSYFDEVTESLQKEGILEDACTEFLWTVGDPESMSVVMPEDQELFMEVSLDTYQKIEKLATETRLAARTPLLKRDPMTQGLYNGIEMVMAILDEREPVTIDRYGNMEKEAKR